MVHDGGLAHHGKLSRSIDGDGDDGCRSALLVFGGFEALVLLTVKYCSALLWVNFSARPHGVHGLAMDRLRAQVGSTTPSAAPAPLPGANPWRASELWHVSAQCKAVARW